MRDREAIKNNISWNLHGSSAVDGRYIEVAILEVLLDIRDLLSKKE